MITYFISDLHLSHKHPDRTKCFLNFMQDEAIHAEKLYILGDLFDFWIGDNDQRDWVKQIKREISNLTQAGVSCFFIPGNRDFLLGQKFCDDTGMTLLDDITIINLYGQSTAILHGDTLCTNDVDYQKFRRIIRQKWLRIFWYLIPFKLKLSIVQKGRRLVGKKKQKKQLKIMDVTPSEVVRVMEQYGVTQMIHGHTHRPAVHQVTTRDGDGLRIVLGDWDKNGSVLISTHHGFELETRAFPRTK